MAYRIENAENPDRNINIKSSTPMIDDAEESQSSPWYSDDNSESSCCSHDSGLGYQSGGRGAAEKTTASTPPAASVGNQVAEEDSNQKRQSHPLPSPPAETPNKRENNFPMLLTEKGLATSGRNESRTAFSDIFSKGKQDKKSKRERGRDNPSFQYGDVPHALVEVNRNPLPFSAVIPAVSFSETIPAGKQPAWAKEEATLLVDFLRGPGMDLERVGISGLRTHTMLQCPSIKRDP